MYPQRYQIWCPAIHSALPRVISTLEPLAAQHQAPVGTQEEASRAYDCLEHEPSFRFSPSIDCLVRSTEARGDMGVDVFVHELGLVSSFWLI